MPLHVSQINTGTLLLKELNNLRLATVHIQSHDVHIQSHDIDTKTLEKMRIYIDLLSALIIQLNASYLYNSSINNEILTLILENNIRISESLIYALKNFDNKQLATFLPKYEAQITSQKNIVLYINRSIKVLSVACLITCFFMTSLTPFYVLLFLAISAAAFSMTPDRTGAWASLGSKYLLTPLMVSPLVTTKNILHSFVDNKNEFAISPQNLKAIENRYQSPLTIL